MERERQWGAGGSGEREAAGAAGGNQSGRHLQREATGAGGSRERKVTEVGGRGSGRQQGAGCGRQWGAGAGGEQEPVGSRRQQRGSGSQRQKQWNS